MVKHPNLIGPNVE